MDVKVFFIPDKKKLMLALFITILYVSFLVYIQGFDLQCHPITLFERSFRTGVQSTPVPSYCPIVDAVKNSNYLFYYSGFTYMGPEAIGYELLHYTGNLYMHFITLFTSLYFYFLVSYVISCAAFLIINGNDKNAPPEDSSVKRKRVISFAKWLIIIPVAVLLLTLILTILISRFVG